MYIIYIYKIYSIRCLNLEDGCGVYDETIVLVLFLLLQKEMFKFETYKMNCLENGDNNILCGERKRQMNESRVLILHLKIFLRKVRRKENKIK